MIYIYDIIVNFKKNELLEFYEWNENDNVINIKKIKLLRVSSRVISDLIKFNCIIDKELLFKICGTCELYNKSKNKMYEYACLVSDGNIVLAINISKDGKVYEKSKLLLDEENEISILANNIEEYNLIYRKIKKIESYKYLTRKEIDIYNFLYNEIYSCYQNKEYSKLKYLYQEYFDKDMTDVSSMYNELLDSLRDINERHKNIYKLLIQIKKQV